MNFTLHISSNPHSVSARQLYVDSLVIDFRIQLKVLIQTKEKSGSFFCCFFKQTGSLEYFLDWSEFFLKASRRADSRMGSVILWVTALFLLMQRCLCITEQTNRGCNTWTSDGTNVCCEACLPGE